MTEHEWLTSNDPQAMLRLAERTSNEGMIIAIPRQALFRVSDRKLRLWCDALRQMKFYDLPRGSYRRNWNQGEPDPDEQSGEVERLVRLWAAVGVGNCEPSQSTKANLLRDIFGNPWKPVIIQPHWLTPTVKALAQAAYEERQNPACYHCRGAGRVAPAQTEGIAITVQSTPCRTCHGTGRLETGHLDPDRLLILSDALEEAGCPVDWCPSCGGYPHQTRCEYTLCADHNELLCLHPVLKHLRSAGPHVRGCWVLDLLLGKE